MRQLALATSWGELRLVGGSRAGEGSVLLLPQLRLALDAGRPARALVPMQHVVVSHGHLDHLLGLPAWASQRQLQGIAGGTVLAPPGLAGRLSDLLALAAEMEGGKPYDVRVTPVAPGASVRLRSEFDLAFFATSHWVETLGCRLEWRRRRLHPELAGLPAEELRRRRVGGEPITEEVRGQLLAYLADTGPEVFEREPSLFDVEVMVVECTFLRPGDVERARRYGHMHLTDLVDLAPRLAARHVVVTHLSRRHRLGPGGAKIRHALTGRLAGQLHSLNVEWE
jgi:ribonuclease Z